MTLFLLCLKIFFSRILDVSLGTVRTILNVKGKIAFATIISFVEVLIWFLVAREALSSSNSGIFVAIAYAGGYAAGTFVGGELAKKFISGNLTVQIITTDKNDNLVSRLRREGHGVSVVNVNASDFSGEKYMLICEIKQKKLNDIKKTVYEEDPKAFVFGSETKFVQNGFIK